MCSPWRQHDGRIEYRIAYISRQRTHLENYRRWFSCRTRRSCLTGKHCEAHPQPTVSGSDYGDRVAPWAFSIESHKFNYLPTIRFSLPSSECDWIGLLCALGCRATRYSLGMGLVSIILQTALQSCDSFTFHVRYTFAYMLYVSHFRLIKCTDRITHFLIDWLFTVWINVRALRSRFIHFCDISKYWFTAESCEILGQRSLSPPQYPSFRAMLPKYEKMTHIVFGISWQLFLGCETDDGMAATHTTLHPSCRGIVSQFGIYLCSWRKECKRFSGVVCSKFSRRTSYEHM